MTYSIDNLKIEFDKSILQNFEKKTRSFILDNKEKCGLLFGKQDKNLVLIKDFIFTRNIHKNPYNESLISFDAICHYQKKYKKKNMDLLGQFHIHHVGLASSPSKQDIEATQDERPWLFLLLIMTSKYLWIVHNGMKQKIIKYSL